MKRLLLVLALVSVPATTYAQFPSQNISLPSFVIPASGGAVNASGVLSTECLTWPLTTKLCEDAAHTLAQRNGTNAQSARWYRTTDAGITNFARASLFFSGNDIYIGQDSGDIGGTGAAGDIIFTATTGKNASFRAGASRLNWTDTGGAQLILPSAGAYSATTKFVINTAPSGPVACTLPTVTWHNGTSAFQIDVGTTCAGISTLVVTLPAMTNAYVCFPMNVTTSATARVEMTASTTTTATFTNYTRTTGVALAWVDGADVRIGCLGG